MDSLLKHIAELKKFRNVLKRFGLETDAVNAEIEKHIQFARTEYQIPPTILRD